MPVTPAHVSLTPAQAQVCADDTDALPQLSRDDLRRLEIAEMFGELDAYDRLEDAHYEAYQRQLAYHREYQRQPHQREVRRKWVRRMLDAKKHERRMRGLRRPGRPGTSVTLDGVTRTFRQWTEHFGINFCTAWTRIHDRGWSAERALKTPAVSRGGRHKKPELGPVCALVLLRDPRTGEPVEVG